MPKMLYIANDDAYLLEIILQALRTNGYIVDVKESDENDPRTELTVQYTAPTQKITLGDITLDLDSVSVYDQHHQSIHFTPIEFAMLAYLMKNAHRAVSRNELLPAVWGFENTDNSRVADDTVKRLRRKLKDTNVVLETVWKFGFRIRTK